MTELAHRDKTGAIAFASLMAEFPAWRAVLGACDSRRQEEVVEVEEVEEAVRVGGLAEIKIARVRTILKPLLREGHFEEPGKQSLEYLHALRTEEVVAELSRFKARTMLLMLMVLLLVLLLLVLLLVLLLLLLTSFASGLRP